MTTKKFSEMTFEEQISIIEAISKCTSQAVRRTFCAEYEIPHQLVPQQQTYCQSIEDYMKDRDFQGRNIADVYAEYCKFCLDNNYSIETRQMMTRTIKNVLGYNSYNGKFITGGYCEEFHVDEFLNELNRPKMFQNLTVKSVYNDYINFCKSHNYTPTNNIRFGREMRVQGYHTEQIKIDGVTTNIYIRND